MRGLVLRSSFPSREPPNKAFAPCSCQQSILTKDQCDSAGTSFTLNLSHFPPPSPFGERYSNFTVSIYGAFFPSLLVVRRSLGCLGP